MFTRIMDAPFIKEMINITDEMWRLGWDERNGGNISYLLKEEEVSPFLDTTHILRTIDLNFQVKGLANQFFLVTGSGKYFRKVKNNPEECLGLIQVNTEGTGINILWGFANNSVPTSELPTHFMGHIERLKVDPNHRVVMHCHPTHTVAMTFTHKLDKTFTKTLWQMCTECIVVFPEGVALLPWMVPGTAKIGEATAKELPDHRLVIWPHHGIFGVGESIDDAFGLIETAEKAAEVYSLVSSHKNGMIQTITDQELNDLAEAFNVTPNPKYI